MAKKEYFATHTDNTDPAMITLEQIQHPIADSLNEFDSFIVEQFRTDNEVMGTMLKDALGTRQGGAPPISDVLGCDDIGVGHSLEACFIAAMMVEMIQFSSLIHDDVIDESLVLCSKPSLNAKWQSKRLFGGRLYPVRNISIGLSSGQFDLVSHGGDNSHSLRGGGYTDDRARRRTITREEYLGMVEKKTAVLISVSASAGAKAAGATPEVVSQMREFGRALGMAFQIQDDILDYDLTSQSGKESYQDLFGGRLPCHYLSQLSRAMRLLDAQCSPMSSKPPTTKRRSRESWRL